jgi:hypothetical protein
MVAKITPRLIELTYEATLKSYWRKQALRKFLLASNVAESHLATWGSEESKRDFLDRTFQKLQASDRGKAIIFDMARGLSDQNTFPDLRNWEDSKLKIAEATEAVAELNRYLHTQEEEIRSEREREQAKASAREARHRIQRSLTDKSKLQIRLDASHSSVGRSRVVTTFRTGSMICWTTARFRIAGHICPKEDRSMVRLHSTEPRTWWS